MNSNSTSRMPMLAGVGLALAAILLLLPAHGHAATLNVTDDAFVSGNNTSKNFGTKKVVKVDGTKLRRGFAKFDLSVLGGAVGADIDTATLRIWVSKVKVGGSIDIHQVITTNWFEASINDGNAPPLAASLVTVAIAAADENTYVLVNADVTTLVKAWLDGTSNFGVAIVSAGARIDIDSKENKKTSHPMEIEVTTIRSATLSIEAQQTALIGQIIGGGISGNDLQTCCATRWVPMFHGDSAQEGADEATSVMPLEGVVSDLHVLLEDSPGSSSDGYTFTIARDVAPAGTGALAFTDMKCDIVGTDSPLVCSDADEQCFVSGDGIVLRVVPFEGTTIVPSAMTWTAVFRPGGCE